MHPEAAAVLAHLTDPSWRVLEVGPGGTPTPWPADRYVSVDHTPAGTRGTAGNQAGVVSVATHHGDMDTLPFPPCSFDALISRHVIEHHPDTLTVLREWRRVLRPGGLLIAVTPDQADYPGSTIALDETHEASFTPRQLAALVAHAGFAAVATEPCQPAWSFLVRAVRSEQ